MRFSEITDAALAAETEALERLLSENASAGATAASSVAVSVGGIGMGFDPKGDKGIYQGKAKRKAKTEDAALLMRRNPIAEGWDHYTEIGHKAGSSTVWYMLPGGKIETAEFPRKGKKYNHQEEIEVKAIAVGRIDPKQNKISIRPPLAPGNSFYSLTDRKLEFVVSRLERAYPDFEIWYFGEAATDIRRVDSFAAPTHAAA
jgi:hypothetical protein